MPQNPDPPIQSFASPELWKTWLEANHARWDQGIWLRIYKKGTDEPTVTYAEALDEALCFGWIDGQKKPYDERSWLQKFTPRRARSLWSQRNIEHVTRLIGEQRMRPAGLAEIEAAKQDGRWANAYAPASQMTVPEDFLDRLKEHPQAFEFFLTLNKANTYAIAWRLTSAKKPETRENRMNVLLDMMKKGQKLH